MPEKKEVMDVYADIPVNYNEGFNLFGKTFKRRFMFDAVIIGIIFGAVMYFIMYEIFMKDGDLTLLAYAAIGFGVGFTFGAFGHNNDPWSIYLLNKLRMKRNKRITLYNARIKYEQIDAQKTDYQNAFESYDNQEEAQSIYDRFLERMAERGKNRAAGEEKNVEVDEKYVFEDDIGVSSKVPEIVLKKYQKKGVKADGRKEKKKENRERR